MSAWDELYRENILDHYQHPRHQGVLDQPDVTYEDANPLCGDRLRMDFRIVDGRIADVAFSGHGCSISQASASMMTENVKGHSLAEAENLAAAFKAVMNGDGSPEALGEAEELQALQGVKRYPVRVKCALLAWAALLEALEMYRKRASA
jgi:nitrogen fixation protein NifU and related proteins